ncbi:MAG: CAAX protease [Bacteroides sp.]|nr:CAAX protease [Bacteroides sp.]
MTVNLDDEWLRDSIIPDGVFTEPILWKTRDIITFAHRKLQQSQSYTHDKLLAEMEFGIWKYMFSPVQYRVTGRNLLSIFPNKPRSSREIQYNQTYIFNELDKVNSLCNRIAHHETICFVSHTSTIDIAYVINIYTKIKTLFSWMDIDSNSLLYGLDHINRVCAQINQLKNGL